MELQCYHDIVDKADRYLFMPRNEGMVMDAANVLRLNDRMLFLESPSGNRAAYNWMCEQFPNVKIELCNFYSGVHIDSTIVALREGLVMLNASRVTFDQVPEVFDGWHKVWVTDVVAQGFYQYPYASKWIGMNMLVVDPNTVIVDQAQTELIKTLKSYQFTVIPLQLRHSRTLGGGFHCVTLDLVRN
jgi:N-dimethylarginine dimethylaminohydrolase